MEYWTLQIHFHHERVCLSILEGDFLLRRNALLSTSQRVQPKKKTQINFWRESFGFDQQPFLRREQWLLDGDKQMMGQEQQKICYVQRFWTHDLHRAWLGVADEIMPWEKPTEYHNEDM